MKPQELAAAIRKRWWLIVIIVLLSALVASLVARVIKPSYKVEITITAVAPKNPTTKMPDATISGVYVVAMPSIASAVEGIDIAEAVSERLALSGINIPPDELVEKVSAEAEVQQPIARVTFTDESPTRVAEIANTWATVLEQKSSDDPELYDPNFKELLLNGRVNVTNRAVPPDKPAQPKPMVYLGLGIFIGLLLGFSLVIGIEYFDPHFRSISEVEEVLGIPVLGIVPKLKGTEATSLLTSLEQGSPAHEAYSQLRTTLMFSIKDRPSRSISVMPIIPTEVSPYISANLAISIAHTKREVLLIDGDLREQAITRLLQASDKPGLSDSLAKSEPVQQRIINTNITNLHFLPAGKPVDNSSDLLSLPIFDEYLQELEKQYDEVILHTPPILAGIDAVILSSKTNLGLIVVDSQKCTRNTVQKALESLDLMNIKSEGVILNNVKLSRKERAARALSVVPTKPTKKKEAAAAGAVLPLIKEEVPKTAMEGAGVPAAKRKPKKKAKVRPGKPVVPTGEKPERVAPEKVGTGLKKRASLKAGTEGLRESRASVTSTADTAKEKEEEIQQMRSIISDDFQRLGETGAPIPKYWLRALNSDKPDVKESAITAISTYYNAYLRRYHISEQSIEPITKSIIRMMFREGEFATMNRQEAQQHLHKMMVDAGAKFSSSSRESKMPTADERPEDSLNGEHEKA